MQTWQQTRTRSFRSSSQVALLVLGSLVAGGCSQDAQSELSLNQSPTLHPQDTLSGGPYAVGSTNLEVSDEYLEWGDDVIHSYLLGLPDGQGNPRFLTDLLKFPQSAWVTDVVVPDQADLYGPASGTTQPVVTYVVYPTVSQSATRPYEFPYANAQYGSFDHMLSPDEQPVFAQDDKRFPLILLSHGSGAHGLYDVRHAHRLASHGFIVAVLTYGDDRTRVKNEFSPHAGFLRPLKTRAVLDALLASDTFGPHIDTHHIGLSGHSFGGFTGLAMAGGPYQGSLETVNDPRVTAAVLAAPWTGGRYGEQDVYAFGDNNQGLARVSIPILCAFGSRDKVTQASFILPAMRQLLGPTYVVELIDQPHVFDGPSWEDRDRWELLFFEAYLKDDADALRTLQSLESMPGGGQDKQLFDYQKLPSR